MTIATLSYRSKFVIALVLDILVMEDLMFNKTNTAMMIPKTMRFFFEVIFVQITVSQSQSESLSIQDGQVHMAVVASSDDSSVQLLYEVVPVPVLIAATLLVLTVLVLSVDTKTSDGAVQLGGECDE